MQFSKRELEEIDSKFRKGMKKLINDSPFYGMAMAEMEIFCDHSCQTMWTDGKRLGYSPVWVNEKSISEIILAQEHEMEHKNLAHPARAKGKDHTLANMAADYVANSILVKNGRTLPETWLYSEEFAEKSFDEIYGILSRKQQEDNQQQDDQQEEQEQQDDQGDDQQDSGNDQGDNQQDDQNGNGQGKGDGEEDGESEGEGIGGDPGGAGEIRVPVDEDGNELDDAEIEKEIQEAETKAMQYARIADSFGQLGAGTLESVAIMKEPKVDWKEKLAQFVDQIARNDYTFSRPRQLGNCILPTLYAKELGMVDVYIDTSGSIEEDELNQFASEAESIMITYNVRLRIVQCDEKVNHVDEFDKNEDVILTMHGGGGTAFAPAIAWSMAHDEQPICGVYLTDLDGYDFGPEPDFPVLWIQTKGNRAKKPPFGEVVKMYPGL